ncbi:hypothetical protein [Massilia sp. TSP1-1-2]|uniref:hypothetical protein n=1 Tax=Massilia sp. TSP1-1-2 TaxID=2804649 RepID=UPI003CEF3EEB
MEEIGYRTDIFNLDGIAGSQRDYIHWLLGVSTGNMAEPVDSATSSNRNARLRSASACWRRACRQCEHARFVICS